MNLAFSLYYLNHCYILEKTGLPCITCGFTRAFESLMKGNLEQSIQNNAGLIPFLVTIAVIIFSQIKKGILPKIKTHYFVYCTIFILFSHWIIKIFTILHKN